MPAPPESEEPCSLSPPCTYMAGHVCSAVLLDVLQLPAANAVEEVANPSCRLNKDL